MPEDLIPGVLDERSANVMCDNRVIDLRLCDSESSNGNGVDAHFRGLARIRANVIVLVFRSGEPDTFDNLQTYWHRDMRKYMLETPFILVATKTNLREDMATIESLHAKLNRDPISKEEGEEMAESLGASAYLECSSYRGVGVRAVFSKAIQVFLDTLVEAPASVSSPSHTGTKFSRCIMM